MRRAAGSEFLGLDALAAPAGGVTTWLTAAVRDAVLDGRLAQDCHLPATRTLATELGVARGVVVEAYRRLTDEGLLHGRPGVGTVVLKPPAPAHPPDMHTRALDSGPAPPRLPVPAAQATSSVRYDLSPGLPDLAAFPRAAWLRAERAVLRDAGSAELGYGDPRGHPRLREVLARRLVATRGVRVGPDEVLVVAGVAQALALLAQALTGAGHTAVAVEDPGSLGAQRQMAHWGLEPVGVPVDDSGLDVAGLSEVGVAAVLVTPAHQFPTGVVLSPGRRRALLDWALPGRLVIEDDYDAEHRYDRAPVRALQSSAPDRVAYTGSTSKTLAPGLRLGWLVPPRDLHARLVTARHASDLGSPALPQLVLARLIDCGDYDRHLRLVRQRQRRRRDAVLAALAQYLPGIRVEGVAAGLHLLITLPPRQACADDAELAAGLRDAGVLVHPLSRHRQRPGPPGLVLGYAAHTPDQLHDAVRRLARSLRQHPKPTVQVKARSPSSAQPGSMYR